MRRSVRFLWIGCASVLCALILVGEHLTPLGVLGLSLIVTLGVGILAGSIFLTRRPKDAAGS